MGAKGAETVCWLYEGLAVPTSWWNQQAKRSQKQSRKRYVR